MTESNMVRPGTTPEASVIGAQSAPNISAGTSQKERPPSCADWVERNDGRPLTDFQRIAMEVLVQGMNTGPWNLSVSWRRVDWDFGGGVRFCMRSGGLATFDFDHLTRLVLAAHDRCVRLDLEPASRGYIYVIMHPRQREGDMTRRHPTIEDAIAKFRGLPEPVRSEATITDGDAVPGTTPKEAS